MIKTCARLKSYLLVAYNLIEPFVGIVEVVVVVVVGEAQTKQRALKPDLAHESCACVRAHVRDFIHRTRTQRLD